MLILKYIMDQCANMRGTYFVKFLSVTQKANTMYIQVTSLATQTKVLSTVASSKAGEMSKIMMEKKLWGSVGESVIKHSLHSDNLEATE